MPLTLGLFANALIPYLLGVLDLVFPRVNNFSFWVLPVALGAITSAVAIGEGTGLGWTIYPPLSLIEYASGISTDLAIFSLHLGGIGSITGALNFTVTVIAVRGLKVELGFTSVFVWAVITTSMLLILALPVLAGGITMMLFDRHFNSSFFDPMGGGDPVFFEHLFWFFGHPEVYIIILPVFGILGHVLSGICDKKVYGYLGMVYAIVSIGFIGFFVWAHHMYVAGIDLDTGMYFSGATMAIAIPTAIKLFSWCATIFSGQVLPLTPYWFCMAFSLTFLIGGVTGVTCASPALDVIIHDTYFVVAHFHYVLSIGAVFGIFIGIYYWYSMFLLEIVQEMKCRCNGLLLVAGVNGIFAPLFMCGFLGLPRRIFEYSDCYYPYWVWSAFGFNLTYIGVFFIFFMCMFATFKKTWYFESTSWDSISAHDVSNSFLDAQTVCLDAVSSKDRFSKGVESNEFMQKQPLTGHNV